MAAFDRSMRAAAQRDVNPTNTAGLVTEQSSSGPYDVGDSRSPVYDYFYGVCTLGYNGRPEAFGQLWTTHGDTLKAFWDGGKDKGPLFLHMDEHDRIHVTDAFPAQRKGQASKVTAVFKSEGGEVDSHEMHPDEIQSLRLWVEELMLPAIAKSRWPRCVAEDTASTLSSFLTDLQRVEGQLKGLLVLPHPVMYGGKTEMDVTTAQQTITLWSKQIRQLLHISEETDTGLRHPSAIVDYWKRRSRSLKHVVEQLSDPRARTMVQLLADDCSSPYSSGFDALQDEVDVANREATELHAHLAKLEPHLRQLESGEYVDGLRATPIIIHLLALIWYACKTFTSVRLGHILTAVGNALVHTSTMHIDPDTLWQQDPEQALKRVTSCLQLCNRFKSLMFGYRTQVNAMCNYRQWHFESSDVFIAIDGHIERLRILETLFQNLEDCSKLQNFELGGADGGERSEAVRMMIDQLKSAVLAFREMGDNLLDSKTPAHVEKFVSLQRDFEFQVRKFDHFLSSMVNSSFQQCYTVQKCVKLLDALRPHMTRQVLIDRVMDNVPLVLHRYAQDLDACLREFNKRNSTPTQASAQRYSAEIQWVRSLKQRANEPFTMLKSVNKSILSAREGDIVMSKCSALVEMLEQHEQQLAQQWTTRATTVMLEKLDVPVFVFRHRKGREVLVVNLDPTLGVVLEEAQPVLLLGVEVGGSVGQYLQSASDIRLHNARLDAVACEYNDVMDSLIEVEKPLVSRTLHQIASVIDEGISSAVTWRSPGLSDYIARMNRAVHHLHCKIKYLKANVTIIQRILKAWRSIPNVLQFNMELLQETRKRNILSEFTAAWAADGQPLSDKEKIAKKWLKKWRQHVSYDLKTTEDLFTMATRVYFLVEASRQAVDADRTSMAWAQYADYLDDIFKRGIVGTLRKALEFLIKNLEVVRNVGVHGFSAKGAGVPRTGADSGSHFRAREAAHLLEVKLDLIDHQARYTPSIDREDFASVQFRVHEWVSSIFEIARKLKRLTDAEANYFEAATENEMLGVLKDEVLRLMHATVDKLDHVRMDFFKYSYLWSDESSVYVENYLKGHYTHQPDKRRRSSLQWGDDDPMATSLRPPDADSVAAESTRNKHGKKKVKLAKPSLLEVENEISRYEKLCDEIKELPTNMSYGWLKVDATPFRAQLHLLANKWRKTFIEKLQQRVVRKLDKFYAFVERLEPLIRSDISKYEELVNVMKCLVEFSICTEKYDKLLDPLKEIIAILKRHEVTVAPETQQRLDQAAVVWRDFKKHCFSVNDNLIPMQQREIARIRDLEAHFVDSVETYRNGKFLEKAPFHAATLVPHEAYRRIYETFIKVQDLEKQLLSLREKQSLFQLTPCLGKQLQECHYDLVILKHLWDAHSLVQNHIAKWNTVAFAKLNSDDIEDDFRKLFSHVKSIDKRARTWGTYAALEKTLKDMMMTIPLIQNLRNPALKESHWAEMLERTQVKFQFTDDVTLEQLTSLQLHEHVDIVSATVEKAVKEQQMEKQIGVLAAAWADLKFTFEPFKDDIVQAVLPDALQGLMEEHQLVLQQLAASRYAASYADELHEWQRKLSAVEATCGNLSEMQRRWLYLMTIFSDSEDVVKQLPEEAALFGKLDKQAQSAVRQLQDSSHVIVEECGKRCLMDPLDDILAGLTRCERALDQYLETKRKIFPRFYFISAPDLLEMISTAARNPGIATSKHMPKIFQGAASFRYQTRQASFSGAKGKASGSEGSTIIYGCESVGNETLEFKETIPCTRKVEEWCQKVKVVLCDHVKSAVMNGIQQYMEYPREQWVLATLGQVCLLVSQLMWTVETTTAFRSLEEGNEMAMREMKRKCDDQLRHLIMLVQGDLDDSIRTKVMNMVTYDVHARDVVSDLIEKNVENDLNFNWTKQLRQRWDENLRRMMIDIVDTSFEYGNEYFGNTLRLVVTPLTDRIYITLTQALHLKLGGAPAGPAGTGKTETVKDLGSQLGKPVFVFNCSDQMTTKTLGDTFKGLASAGAWGCFDEFNRIGIEVLSVLSTQYKCVLDAIRENKKSFTFQGDTSSLDPTCGVFITMNPGYLGRTELPDSLKALFRPVTVVAPDISLICENMLMAEGFVEARVLAKKFITVFQLSGDLLSKQSHYDWGLRAVKSLLVVAGSTRRSDPTATEEAMLMRALRDFNMPKIVPEDTEIFLALIKDLFPGITMPRKADADLDDACKGSCNLLGLQSEESLLLKCSQLYDLMKVRHSVFIIGPPGCGKSSIWQVLAGALRGMGMKTTVRDLNPKVVSTAELYGHMLPSKEWRDGLLSSVMREMSLGLEDHQHKWIVLDGDLDTNWIESMNSVMDDNKLLTLASNERIILQPSMRLVLEITHLRYATPATVSRAGILYVSATDIGWQPALQSYFEGKPTSDIITPLADKYVSTTLEFVALECKHWFQTAAIQMVHTLCWLLERLLLPEFGERDAESVFVFCCVWAFGGGLRYDATDSVGTPQMTKFDRWWRHEWRSVKFPPPEQGTVYDFYYNTDTHRFERWVDKVAVADGTHLSSPLVWTPQAAALNYLGGVLTEGGHPVMLVGSSGTGKSLVVSTILGNLPANNYSTSMLYFNYFTTSEWIQSQLESSLEKKAGRSLQPTGNKKLVVCIDDLNMPAEDQYGTQTPIAFLRQHLDYGHWYERTKWVLHDVSRVQYIATMNPTTGNFTVNPRLQRHFATFAAYVPPTNVIKQMLGALLGNKFASFGKQIVNAIVDTHEGIVKSCPKTPACFQYDFNLRHLCSAVKGILRLPQDLYGSELLLARGVLHELTRSYSDTLSTPQDVDHFRTTTERAFISSFPSVDVEQIVAEPLIHCSFADGRQTPGTYNSVAQINVIREFLASQLADYNDTFAPMDLVLFDEAVSHIVRVARLLESSTAQNIFYVGVGGSGKQSLTRLAAYVCDFVVANLQAAAEYARREFREDLRELCMRAGVKNAKVVLLMNDLQMSNPDVLVDLNQWLASGPLPGIFAPEDVELVTSKLAAEVRAALIADSPEHTWAFFLDKVRKRTRTILCCSPNDQLRVRVRRFPALLAHCSFCYFFPWSNTALSTVAAKFLAPLELTQKELAAATEFLTLAHARVEAVATSPSVARTISISTTPRLFINAVSCFVRMYQAQRLQLQQGIQRYATGLQKLKQAAEDTTQLQAVLAVKRGVVEEKRVAAEDLLMTLNADKEIVANENAKAMDEERRAMDIQQEVTMHAADCEEDLVKAEPMLRRAEEALDTLNKNNLTELKTFKSPPQEVKDVMACVLILMSPTGTARDRSWAAGVKFMGRVDIFLQQLKDYDKENIKDAAITALKPYLAKPSFVGDAIAVKSFAAAGLCEWVINVVEYFRIYCVVEPKRKALDAAKQRLDDANTKLQKSKNHVQKLKAKLDEMQAAFDGAERDKNNIIREVENNEVRLALSHRLVDALDSENDRWQEEVQRLSGQNEFVLGDTLIAAMFVNYIAPFALLERDNLLHNVWISALQRLEIQYSAEGVDPLATLSNQAEKARWYTDGLPNDPISTQNACIMHRSVLVPLLVDPQLQGYGFVDTHYRAGAENRGGKFVRIASDSDRLGSVLEDAVPSGDVVVVEMQGTGVASVSPLLRMYLTCLSEAAVMVQAPPPEKDKKQKKGKAKASGTVVRIAGRNVMLHKDFKLLLHTRHPDPQFGPEVQAAVAMVNFAITPEGLTEQLLAAVVSRERSDAEAELKQAAHQVLDLQIALTQLEDRLINQLGGSTEDLLEIAVVESTERMKQAAKEIKGQIQTSVKKQQEVQAIRQNYRPIARRGSVVFFVMQELRRLEFMYQFSLEWFMDVFNAALKEDDDAESNGDISSLANRITFLTDRVTYCPFSAIRRALFENHRIAFALMLAVAVADELTMFPASQLAFLINGPQMTGDAPKMHNPPAEWIGRECWRNLVLMSNNVEGMDRLAYDVETTLKRWRDWLDTERPESERFPGDWKGATELQKLLIIKVLRPDRFSSAALRFIGRIVGSSFVDPPSQPLDHIYKETSGRVPVLFVLFPGADPASDVELLCRKVHKGLHVGFTNIAMGEGQDVNAMEALRKKIARGGWVLLQNVHLMARWLPELERLLDSEAGRDPHKDFRLFVTAEPSADPHRQLPQGLLTKCIKITNEPPLGLKASMQRAFADFSSDYIDSSIKQNEFKTMLFSLSFFHTVMVNRNQFGTRGWSRKYTFSTGDLQICANVIYNYLDQSASMIQWIDLRFIVGEIMYGGHITDIMDRRVCAAYLETFLSEGIFNDGWLAPGYASPPPGSYAHYLSYIDQIPMETPALFGLHPNAEIRTLATRGTQLANMLFALRACVSCGDGERKAETKKQEEQLGASMSATVDGALLEEAEQLSKEQEMLEDILNRIPEYVNSDSIAVSVSATNPYVSLLLQEIVRMNKLLTTVRETSGDLVLGLKGQLTISDKLDTMLQEVSQFKVPTQWQTVAYPSVKSLRAWVDDLVDRCRALDAWAAAGSDGSLPKCIWISGLFNPSSLITAVQQATSRRLNCPLDSLFMQYEVLKKFEDDVVNPPRDGAHIYGMVMEGAKWDASNGTMAEQMTKELYPSMPVVHVRAVVQEPQITANTYQCPVYATPIRGPTLVFSMNLRTAVEPPSHWIVRGACALLSTE